MYGAMEWFQRSVNHVGTSCEFIGQDMNSLGPATQHCINTVYTWLFFPYKVRRWGYGSADLSFAVICETPAQAMRAQTRLAHCMMCLYASQMSLLFNELGRATQHTWFTQTQIVTYPRPTGN